MYSNVQVCQQSYQVDRSSSADASSVLALLKVSSDSAHRKLQTCLARAAD